MQLHKLIKSDFEYRNVVQVLRKNAKVLKDLFYSLASADDRYPKLGYFKFVEFCKSTRVIEEVSQKYPEQLISTVDWVMVRNEVLKNETGTNFSKGNRTGDSIFSPLKTSATKKFTLKPKYTNFIQDQVGMQFAKTILKSSQLIKEHEAPLSIQNDRDRRLYMIRA